MMMMVIRRRFLRRVREAMRSRCGVCLGVGRARCGGWVKRKGRVAKANIQRARGRCLCQSSRKIAS